MSLSGIFFRGFYEVAAKGKGYEDFLQKLQKNETTVYQRMINATDSTFNRTRAAHVIGIERWSAHRLRVLLGEPLIVDEYDGYAPSEQLSMVELAEEFKQTRDATIALVRELQNKGIALTQTVMHNEVGNLSLGGWLFYIENHTGRETMLMIQQRHNKEKETANP
jgi:hypothetical protein